MTLQDEKIHMAFTAANSVRSAARKGSGSIYHPDLSPIGSHFELDTPKLDMSSADQISRREAADSPGSNVSTLTKNLDNMGFGSPT